MTYESLKNLTRSLLIGDTKLPTDEVLLRPLVDYGLQKLAMKADSLRLMTKDSNSNIIRLATNKMYIRKPQLPHSDTDDMDIDDELTYALSNYIASFISKNKPEKFAAEAKAITEDFNSKVYDVIMGTEFDPEAKDFII